VPREHKEHRRYPPVMMVFLVHKEHKGFRVHKVRFRDIRELQVPKELQVISVLMVALKVHLA
jgi:hypothetical protein